MEFLIHFGGFFPPLDYLEMYILELRPTIKTALLETGLFTKLRDENHTAGS